ncbi:MAG: hypothetical protein OEV93_04045 [Candidatus Moranbacteria bacterium]|nr:hypothetical protein [Candidatus Moranbacteria bacterium]
MFKITEFIVRQLEIIRNNPGYFLFLVIVAAIAFYFLMERITPLSRNRPEDEDESA